MRYGIFALAGILAACCFGCSAVSRGSYGHTDKSRTEFLQDELKTSSTVSISTINTAVEKWKNIRIEWKVYDTAQKPDSTGRYPLQSEGWVYGNEGETKSTTQDVESVQKEDIKISTQGKVENDIEILAESEKEIKGGSRPLWWWLVGVVSVLGIMILIWWKYGKKD